MSAIYPSTEAGVSAELYLFTRDDRIQAYTSADEDILYNGRTYKRATIRRTPITGVFSADRTTVTVEASIETVFEFLVTDSVRDSMTLQLYRYNRTTATALLAFSGAMDTFSFGGSKASVVFQSDGYLLDVEVPKVVQITTCNHTVYSEHCGLDLKKWVITAKVVRTDYWSTGDVTSSSITLENHAPNARGENLSDITDANLAFSMIEFNGMYRVVSSAEADFVDPTDRLMWLTDMFPADAPKAGDIVSVIQGCNRDPYTCVNRFNNLSNFLGFPYMPKDRAVGEAVPLVYGTQNVNLKNTIWILHASMTSQEGPEYAFAGYDDSSFWSIVCFGPIEWRVLFAPLIDTTALGSNRVDISNAVVRANWIDVSNDGDDGTHPTWAPTPYDALVGAYANELNGVAHVFFAHRNPVSAYAILGSSGKAKDVSIEVRRTLAESPVTPSWIGTEGVTATGVSPAAAIYDILTNTLYGCGIAAARINLTSFDTASAACAAKGYGLNRTWDKVTTARKIIDEICDAFGLMLTVDASGLLYLLMLDTTAALTPVKALTGDDIVDLSLETSAWSNTYNNVYTDAFTYLGPFQVDTILLSSRVEVNDQANQMFTGSVRKKKFDMTCFMTGDFWSVPLYKRLQEVLNEVSIPHASGTVKVGIEHDDLLPGQAIRIVQPLYNIDGLFRITERDIPEDDSNTITLAITQVSGSQFNTDYEETGDESRRTGDPNMTTTGVEMLTVPIIGVPDGKTATSVNEYKTLANIYVTWNTPHSRLHFLATQYLSPLDYDVTLNDEGIGPGGDHLVSVTVNMAKYAGVVNLHNNSVTNPLKLYIAERIY